MEFATFVYDKGPNVECICVLSCGVNIESSKLICIWCFFLSLACLLILFNCMMRINRREIYSRVALC